MKMRFAVLTSAAMALISSFALSARAQGMRPLSVTAAGARSRPKLELGRFVLRLERSHDFGLTGLNLRLQQPKEIAPYLEGRLGDGVVADRPDGALMIPGTPIGLNSGVGATWMSTRGVDIGMDVHRFRHAYLSVALGWLRSSLLVGGFDASDREVSQNVSHDAFLVKAGLTF